MRREDRLRRLLSVSGLPFRGGNVFRLFVLLEAFVFASFLDAFNVFGSASARGRFARGIMEVFEGLRYRQKKSAKSGIYS